jgi:hypothetical protein
MGYDGIFPADDLRKTHTLYTPTAANTALISRSDTRRLLECQAESVPVSRVPGTNTSCRRLAFPRFADKPSKWIDSRSPTTHPRSLHQPQWDAQAIMARGNDARLWYENWAL